MTEPDIEPVMERLAQRIGKESSVMVAFSGGVDSAVVAALAQRALGSQAVAITGVGPALASYERTIAVEVAGVIGIRHVQLPTDEIHDPNYVRNDAKRCFHCKSNLYQALRSWGDQHGFAAILSGTNADDLGDYRPGLQAAAAFDVGAPLAELGIGKETVRHLARYLGLSVADKPASPCLASRIAYGQSVTPERLHGIEQIETLLRSLGFEDVRVRIHSDSLIRLELDLQQLTRACEPTVRAAIVSGCRELGFAFVTLDLAGRQTGSLNRLLPILQS